MKHLPVRQKEYSLELTRKAISITISDCTAAPRMIDVITKFDQVNGRMNLRKRITLELMNTAKLLGVEMNDEIIMMLSDSIIDKYLFDSMEDVLKCLHNAGLGAYPFWGKIEMKLISRWMEEHLEDKAMALERQNQCIKHPLEWEGKTPAERRKSYENAVEAGALIDKKIKETKYQAKHDIAAEEMHEAKYQEFKKKYHKK